MTQFNKAKDIKVGVIGYGPTWNMGRRHLEQMKLAGMTPVAVCDIDESRLPVAEADFPGIETYNNAATMLRKSDVDFVGVITPHNTHTKLALQCLRAGRHVCSEKPLAITTAECDKMIAAAKAGKVMLTTYHNRHWDGCIVQAVKAIKRKKVIGDVLRVEAHMGGYGLPRHSWRTNKTISGGILYDWGVHMLEYSLQLIDSDIREVSAVTSRGYWAKQSPWKADTNEDEAFALVRFKSGQWLTLSNTMTDANCKIADRGWLEITGTKGTYTFTGGDYKIIQPIEGETVVTTGKNPPDQWGKFYKNVANHLVKGQKLVITPQWARRPIHILDLANQSARKGCAMKATYC